MVSIGLTTLSLKNNSCYESIDNSFRAARLEKREPWIKGSESYQEAEMTILLLISKRIINRAT